MTKRAKPKGPKDYPADVEDGRTALQRLAELARKVLEAGKPVDPNKARTEHERHG